MVTSVLRTILSWRMVTTLLAILVLPIVVKGGRISFTCLHHSLPCYVSTSKALTVLFESGAVSWEGEETRHKQVRQLAQGHTRNLATEVRSPETSAVLGLHTDLHCFMFGIPLSLLLYLDPFVTVNNPLKYPISCHICRLAGQDALRGETSIQVVMSAYICCPPPQKKPPKQQQKKPTKAKLLLTFKI